MNDALLSSSARDVLTIVNSSPVFRGDHPGLLALLLQAGDAASNRADRVRLIETLSRAAIASDKEAEALSCGDERDLANWKLHADRASFELGCILKEFCPTVTAIGRGV